MTNTYALTALSPLDGRYTSQLRDVASLFSEFSLIKHRVSVEIEYLLFLAEQGCIPPFTPAQRDHLHSLATSFSVEDAGEVKSIEQTTRHDVKAVEYWLRQKMRAAHVPGDEYLHLALTSEDINGLAYALMVRSGVSLLQKSLHEIERVLVEMIVRDAQTPLLAKTHGQEAVPTTVGKELAVFGVRLLEELQELSEISIEGKLTGAVGNFNAHVVAFPTKNWQALSVQFVTSLGLKPNLTTTQILPPESNLRVFASLHRINGILLDLNQDMWRYISDHVFIQDVAAGQVGSSTMPQKLNPIDFENSEGNLGLANALFTFFLQKLPVSRLQRDLSDSTVKRSFGSAFGYCQLAYLSLVKGLRKLHVNQPLLDRQLDEHWEVLAEADQIILRQHGNADAYDMLRQRTQGKQFRLRDRVELIGALPVSADVRATLESLTPETYLGLAPKIAFDAAQRITHYLEGVS